jgi:hypothetical protein
MLFIAMTPKTTFCHGRGTSTQILAGYFSNEVSNYPPSQHRETKVLFVMTNDTRIHIFQRENIFLPQTHKRNHPNEKAHTYFVFNHCC